MEDNLTATTETSTDPLAHLVDLVASRETLLLIGGPTLLLGVIAAVYLLMRQRKARSEQRELEEAVRLSEDKTSTPASGQPKTLDDPEEKAAIDAHLAKLEPSGTAVGDIAEILATDQTSWLAKLRNGLSKTRDQLSASLSSLFSGKTALDDQLLEKIHESLFRADVGVRASDHLVEHLRKALSGRTNIDWPLAEAELKAAMLGIFADAQRQLNEPIDGPWVILIVGVNGVGKTTTIGKLAAHFRSQDQAVLLGAGDTFRAAAIEQLQIWGERVGVDVVKHKQGSDPAAVAYDAVKAAKARKMDVLLIDTAGRLHNKQELMDELGKVNRVIGKDLPGAPHECWLVIDATTGQNAVQQVKAFKEVVDISGLIVTKLDGTAKGGVLLGITEQFQLPIRYIGVGEKAADLRAFSAQDFVNSIL